MNLGVDIPLIFMLDEFGDPFLHLDDLPVMFSTDDAKINVKEHHSFFPPREIFVLMLC